MLPTGSVDGMAAIVFLGMRGIVEEPHFVEAGFVVFTGSSEMPFAGVPELYPTMIPSLLGPLEGASEARRHTHRSTSINQENRQATA